MQMPFRMAAHWPVNYRHAIAIAVGLCWLSLSGGQVMAQRVLGLDVSYWQGEITQTGWNTAYSTGNRQFVFIRSSRGGTTGLDQPQGTPGGGTTATLSHRYDDSRFIQNITRATTAGLMTGAYHFARPDIAGNTGTDEADHFIQMAGPWMRPGYMPPMFDLEAGQAQTTPEQLAQFSIDFSNRIYTMMQIRPSIYANGNYSNDLAGASLSLRNQIAQPASNMPSVVSPVYPTLVSARWPAGSGLPYSGDIQNGNPKDAGGTLSTFYGPWDDYGVTHPWNFWQYSSGEAIPGFSDSTTDADIAQGDLEYVKDRLIPAVWWNDSSGDWSTLLNWNSGQTPVAPVPGAGQAAMHRDRCQVRDCRARQAAGRPPVRTIP
jgi:GH25 family lysozyme M1 (1,4-beta-N-acetylmuramidase)